jgi:hypothetical protein
MWTINFEVLPMFNCSTSAALGFRVLAPLGVQMRHTVWWAYQGAYSERGLICAARPNEGIKPLQTLNQQMVIYAFK